MGFNLPVLSPSCLTANKVDGIGFQCTCDGLTGRERFTARDRTLDRLLRQARIPLELAAVLDLLRGGWGWWYDPEGPSDKTLACRVEPTGDV
jgi:hypothetical protein